MGTKKHDDRTAEKVHEALHARKKKKLEYGYSRKVTNGEQAIAIGLSKARKKGDDARVSSYRLTDGDCRLPKAQLKMRIRQHCGTCLVR